MAIKADTTLKYINEIGRDGWELLGPPWTQNVVTRDTDSGGNWRDRAYWVECESQRRVLSRGNTEA
jgi:hypothetical protein